MSVSPFLDDDPSMRFAIEEAQRSLPHFFKCFASPKPGQDYFLLKVRFEVEGSTEHVWVADVNASVSPLEGTVANETSLPGITFMDRASFQPQQISDWMIVEDGYMVGGFTTQVIVGRMQASERAEHLASLPYKIRGYDGAA
jgi:uncharacterized protein YegJ (DUF2314 family)